MKVGPIIKLNPKGQIVIPNKVRKALGISTKTPLHVVQRGQGIYLYPIKDVIGEVKAEESYISLLKKTKGSWDEDWQGIRKRRRAVELLASQKRKKTW